VKLFELLQRVKIDRRSYRACWNWIGELNAYGYASYRVSVSGERHRVLAARRAYEVFIGPIADGHVVMHSCDNPRCINPDHLRAGTQRENMRDAVAKGRIGGIKSGRYKHGLYVGQQRRDENGVKRYVRQADR